MQQKCSGCHALSSAVTHFCKRSNNSTITWPNNLCFNAADCTSAVTLYLQQSCSSNHQTFSFGSHNTGAIPKIRQVQQQSTVIVVYACNSTPQWIRRVFDGASLISMPLCLCCIGKCVCDLDIWTHYLPNITMSADLLISNYNFHKNTPTSSGDWWENPFQSDCLTICRLAVTLTFDLKI